MSSYIASYSGRRVLDISAASDEEAVSIAKGIESKSTDDLGRLLSVVKLKETEVVYSTSS